MDSPAPATMELRPLAQLAAQHVILAPAYYVRANDPLGWAATIPRTRDYLRLLDEALAIALADRGLKSQWIYPADLVRAAKGSPTYAVDPYTMGVSTLRSADLPAGTKLGDPLATQLRTMIALQDARAVLVPVELRFERGAGGLGVAVLHVALLDGRLAEVRWSGDIRSEPAAVLSPAVLTSIAGRLADLIAAP